VLEELHRLGVREVLLAPGSRSTPLVRAAAQHDGLYVTIRVDERGMAFHALGLAKGSGRPVAVITTSGTAVANLLPAVVEASMDGVPLILLTADRPPELHGVGANQSIPQDSIFQPFLRHQVTLSPAETRPDLAAVLRTVDAAFAAATGLRPGPVQINCQFREPLAPDEADWDRGSLDDLAAWQDTHGPFQVSVAEDIALRDVAKLAEAITGASRGLLILGTLRTPATRRLARALVARLGWPTYADLRSGLRFGQAGMHIHLDRGSWHSGQAHPDVVLHVGDRVISKRMQNALEGMQPQHYLLLDPTIERPAATLPNPTHVRAPVAAVLTALLERLPAAIPSANVAAGSTAGSAAEAAADARCERSLTQALEQGPALSEAFVARHITRTLPADEGLFCSNSLPVRLVQDFGVARDTPLRVTANRGASGIDGIVSSAIGFAEGIERPTTLLIGDLALLHDLNGLGCLGWARQPLTIVLLNNGGGGIFSLLPIAKHEALLRPYLETPHGLTFEAAARQFGLRHFDATTKEEFVEAWSTARAFGETALIEVHTTIPETTQTLRDLDELLARTWQEPA
jgi:2-succinyl-5-enolpyruvyl-6-hydroxy-3-cyclohexene-1-carboxylate synthase